MNGGQPHKDKKINSYSITSVTLKFVVLRLHYKIGIRSLRMYTVGFNPRLDPRVNTNLVSVLVLRSEETESYRGLYLEIHLRSFEPYFPPEVISSYLL